MKDFFVQIKKDINRVVKLIIKNVCLLIDVTFIFYIFAIRNNMNCYITIVLFIALQLLKSLIIRSRIKIPVLKDTLTIKKENGDIVPKKNSLEKIVIYCNLIEEFIDNNNLRI